MVAPLAAPLLDSVRQDVDTGQGRFEFCMQSNKPLSKHIVASFGPNRCSNSGAGSTRIHKLHTP